MSDKLQDIRAEIDRLDKEIHERLKRRALIIDDIIPIKKKLKSQPIQPAREIATLHRLLSSHDGAISERSLFAVWREIISAMSHIQDTSLRVAVPLPPESDSVALWDNARDYFGRGIPAVRYPAPSSVLTAVRRDDAAFGVLPWPVDGEEKPWWMQLIKQEDDIAIVSAVPCYDHEDDPLHDEVKGLVIAKLSFMPSGSDHSFIALNSAEGISKTKMTKHFEDNGIKPLRIISFNEEGEGETFYLIECDTYLSHNEDRFKTLQDVFLNQDSSFCRVLGGYPVMPVIKK